MFVLQVISGPYKGQATRLEHGQTLVVGRGHVCHLMFDDPKLSSVHAEVTWDDNGFSVFDLHSTHGTWVNGQRIQGRAGLRLGDHVQLGSLIFHLREVNLGQGEELEMIEHNAPAQMLAFDAGATEVAQRGLVRTAGPDPQILADRADRTTMARDVAAAHIDDDVLSATASLKQRVLAGAQGASVLVRRDERLDPFWTLPVSIGREHSSGIVLDDPAVSLRHAVVDLRSDRYLVRDVGSSNGVFVNRKRVVEQQLADGDMISIGSHVMLVVLGPSCLGLNVMPPMAVTSASPARSEARLGVLESSLVDEGEVVGKKRRKKASDIVWYATSDLDRGVFRARAAFIALLLGMALTGWMLAAGDSEVLAGDRLTAAHESAEFLTRAQGNQRDRCTACHVGAGQVATLKCLDCHPDNRPTSAHAAAELECAGCHFEHRGSDFGSAAAAAYACAECHATPHAQMLRTRPRLVAGFDRDAEADVPFHVLHTEQGVACLACHDASMRSPERGTRGACGQCHAPDHPAAGDCQVCHQGHPDRPTPPVFSQVAPIDPPRFARRGLVYTVALLVLSFLMAAVIPRTRKVSVDLPGEGGG